MTHTFRMSFVPMRSVRRVMSTHIAHGLKPWSTESGGSESVRRSTFPNTQRSKTYLPVSASQFSVQTPAALVTGTSFAVCRNIVKGRQPSSLARHVSYCFWRYVPRSEERRVGKE